MPGSAVGHCGAAFASPMSLSYSVSRGTSTSGDSGSAPYASGHAETFGRWLSKKRCSSVSGSFDRVASSSIRPITNPEPRLNLLFGSLFRSAGNSHDDDDNCSDHAVALATVSGPLKAMDSASRLEDWRAAPRLEPGVAAETARVHTPAMTLKSAGVASFDRHDSDDGSFLVLTFFLTLFTAGLGSRGDACSSHSFIRSAASVWLHCFTCSIVRSSRDPGEALFLRTTLAVDPSGRRFCGDLAAGRGFRSLRPSQTELQGFRARIFGPVCRAIVSVV